MFHQYQIMSDHVENQVRGSADVAQYDVTRFRNRPYPYCFKSFLEAESIQENPKKDLKP